MPPSQNHNQTASAAFLNTDTTLLHFRKVVSFPLITAHLWPRQGVEGKSGGRGLGSRMLRFTLEKQKSEIRSPYISPSFLLPQKGQQVSRGCSTQPHHQGSTFHSLTLAAGRWQRWGDWPAAVSGSHPSAPCWGKWSWEQTLLRPWQAELQPQTGARQTPWRTQKYIKKRDMGYYSMVLYINLKRTFRLYNSNCLLTNVLQYL